MMAEAVSDSAKLPAVKPPPKRRRILDPSAIVPVPIYSNKVSSSLQLKPMAAMFTETENTGGGADDAADGNLWSQFSSGRPKARAVSLSDSEEDEAQVENQREHLEKKTDLEAIRSPSPPPDGPVQKQSRQVKQKISEIDRKLRAVNSILSPEPKDSRSRRRRGRLSPDSDDVILINPSEDDVIIVNPNSGPQESSYIPSVREIPLKIRCRTDVHKIPVLSSTALSDVVTRLSVILNVPPHRLLLLKEEVELPTCATVDELGLGIADIIECFVMAAEDKAGSSSSSSSSISVRLQSKDRDSSQEFTLLRDAPLGSIFSQYLAKMSATAQRQVRFHFDGSRVSDSQTPAQLDMEDGDIIEVWI